MAHGRGRGPSDGEEIAAWVRRAQGGDADAFGCLVERYRPTLVRFCRRLVDAAASSDVAEDLAQEALLRAHRSLERLEEPARFGAWVHGIAANLARTWWRQQMRSPTSIDDAVAAGPNASWPQALVPLTPEEAVEEAEQARRVLDAVEALPAALGRAVALYYLHGMSYAEVAAALNVPVSTVRSRLFQSRAKLRLVLEPPESTHAPAHSTTAKTTAKKKGRKAMTQATPTQGNAVPLPKSTMYCSFCGKAHKDVRRLIAGPGGVFICDSCVAKCNEILATEEAKSAGRS